MSVTQYTPGPSKIVHESRVDFRQRVIQSMIHIVQYDKSLPIIAVELYSNGQKWTLPSDANVKVRWGKRDHTYVYLDVLGCNEDRTIIYFEIIEQMTVFYGEHNPVLEVIIGNSVACSSYIPFYIDRNPIQHSDIESEVVPSVVERLEAEIRSKQDILESGTNIKTINGESIMGSGNLTIAVDLSNYYTKSEIDTLLNGKQNTLVNGISIKTVNNTPLLASGNINLVTVDSWQTVSAWKDFSSGIGIGDIDINATGNTITGVASLTTTNLYATNLGGNLDAGTHNISNIGWVDADYSNLGEATASKITLTDGTGSAYIGFDENNVPYVDLYGAGYVKGVDSFDTNKLSVHDSYMWTHYDEYNETTGTWDEEAKVYYFPDFVYDPVTSPYATIHNGTFAVINTPRNTLATQGYVDNKPCIVEITWSDLKTRRDSGYLKPGMQYRITDYQCTTATEGTSSANHQFDIIVTADSANKLNEKARACLHTGDTYFVNSKLDAWELWYCLDNDKTRFAWALVPTEAYLSYSNKKFTRATQYDGVKGNYCWNDGGVEYIFTDTLNAPTTGSHWTLVSGFIWTEMGYVQVQYVPAVSVEGKGVIYRMIDEFGNDCPYDFKNILFTKSRSYSNAYTFTYTQSSTLNDASLLGISKSCYSNVIGAYLVSSGVYQLNFTVFYTTGTTFNCFANEIGVGNHDNIIGSFSYKNSIGIDFNKNTIGRYFTQNIIGPSFVNNTIDIQFTENAIGPGFVSNTIGSHFQYNTIGTEFRSNIIGNFFDHNTADNYVQYNKIGSTQFEDVYVRYCKFNSCIQYISLTSDDTSATASNYLQNIHIHSYVQGSSSTNRKTISVPDRNLSYSIDYYANGSQDIILD